MRFKPNKENVLPFLSFLRQWAWQFARTRIFAYVFTLTMILVAIATLAQGCASTRPIQVEVTAYDPGPIS